MVRGLRMRPGQLERWLIFKMRHDCVFDVRRDDEWIADRVLQAVTHLVRLDVNVFEVHLIDRGDVLSRQLMPRIERTRDTGILFDGDDRNVS